MFHVFLVLFLTLFCELWGSDGLRVHRPYDPPPYDDTTVGQYGDADAQYPWPNNLSYMTPYIPPSPFPGNPRYVWDASLQTWVWKPLPTDYPHTDQQTTSQPLDSTILEPHSQHTDQPTPPQTLGMAPPCPCTDTQAICLNIAAPVQPLN